MQALVRLLVFATLALSLVALPRAVEAQRRGGQSEREIDLDVGTQTTISGVGVVNYSEGPPGVVTVRLTSEGNFVLVAVRPGATSLLLIYQDGNEVMYRITVRDPNASDGPSGAITERENIRLDLYFVELNENYSHQIGIGFPGTIGGPNVGRAAINFDLVGDGAPGFSQATLSLVNQVLPRLDLMQSQGWARLRRQAMVVTANRTPARFNSGGEVNFPVVGGLVAEIRAITYGSEIRMTPRYDSNTGRIELDMQADISELTEPFSPGGPPGRRQTLLQSLVNLEPGQAIVIGGLSSRSEQESQGGLPGLSQIPILGVLFGVNQRRGEATEVLVFVVPTVVQAVPRVQRDYIREAYETFERFGGRIQDIDMYDREPPGYGRRGGTSTGPVDRPGP